MVGLDLPGQQTGRDKAKEYNLKGADLLKRCLSQSIRSQAQIPIAGALQKPRRQNEGMKQGLGFRVTQFLASNFVHSWECPRGHSISKSLQKAFIIKN